MQAPPLDMIFGNYMAWQYEEGTWIISFMEGTEYIYLLEGDEYALLTDTGYGFGHLREFAGLCGAQLRVPSLFPDHSGGHSLDSLSAGHPHALRL